MIRPDNHDSITVPCPHCGAPFEVIYSDLNDRWNAGWWECRACHLRTDIDATPATDDALHTAGEAVWAKENPLGVRPTEVWVRCPGNNCGDDVRMVWVYMGSFPGYWAPVPRQCRGCGTTYNPRQEDELAVLAEVEAQRIEREGPDA